MGRTGEGRRRELVVEGQRREENERLEKMDPGGAGRVGC